MSTGTIILLGAFAGFTIYLGLPLAFLKRAPQRLKTFANMLATGVLVFLFFDVVSKGSEPINSAIETLRDKHTGATTVFAEVGLMVLGFFIGLLGLVYFNSYVIARYKPKKQVIVETGTPDVEPVLVGAVASKAAMEARGERVQTVKAPNVTATVIPSVSVPSPMLLSLMIAVGIGLHNFSEGLAIGQSAVTGAISLATILIIGFGLHNMTEGFGIAGPLTSTEKVSWKFILLLGLIGGGPTFLGTMIGMAFQSDLLFILFLALAAGSILYVIVELLAVAKRTTSNQIIMWGLFVGFLLGYLTDLIVTYAGA
ncbi:ZIP family metal transporter [Tengunoibacter tsumagoiensis]|uniref:Zinc permease n=1 Tax=Tengunoibacter tsumagoiensis TaxID=2014871 RepID=A0A402AA21_9CHLR|nr:ZIP family metal transporter [Tengunoibacter tsumagoiensis]GCE16013.1 hypothetical protein KTT_58720 [Tengunoibacter tsumagoiensis]